MDATFSVGQSVPYVTSTSYGGSYYGPQSTFQQLDVSTELNVTPYITPDGLVVMEIDQNIEEIAGFEEFPNVGKLPRTVHRYASAVVSVRDRETIILGGYIRTSKSKTSSGVPLLKDIPVIGTAFRTKGSDSSRTELIVLIRPTVLVTPEDAAAEAEAERNRLPGIKEMEKNIGEYEESTGDRLKTLFGK
jgi:general secretion pathway protein D